MASTSKLKESFTVQSKHGAFYTGGNVEWHDNYLYCQTSSSISKIDVDTGNVISKIAEESVEDCDTIQTFTSDGTKVVTSHKSGLLKQWNENGELDKSWKYIHKGPLASLRLKEDKLLTGGSDGVVREWDLTHQACLHGLKGCQGVVNMVEYRPTNFDVFASGDDGKICSWVNGSFSVYAGHFSKVTSVVFHHDLIHFVSSGRDKVLILWEIGKPVAIRTVPVYEGVESIVALPAKFKLPNFKSAEGIYVASGGENGIIKVWDVRTSKQIYTQDNALVTKAKEEGGLAICKLLLDTTKKSIAVVSADQNIIIHRLKTFDVSKQLIGFSDEILDLIYVGSDDLYLAVATNSNDIKLYELSTMNCQLLKGHTDLVLALNRANFDPNLIISSSKDNTIRLWTVIDGVCNCVGVGMRHTGSVGSVAFAHTNRFAVSVSQDTCLKVWDVPEKFGVDTLSLTCRKTEMAHQKDINSVCISPNDKIIATGSQDKTAKLWSEDLSLLGVLKGHRRGVWCVRFSPVDQVLLTSSADCTVKLWSIAELNCLKTIEGHESSVMRADFISNGMQILSSGADGLLKVFNLKSSECSLTLDEHQARIWAFALTKDESMFVTGGSDSTLIIWKDTTEEIRLEKIKEMEQLTLEEQQLANYIHNDELLKALKLALKLEKPHQALKIVQGVIKKGDSGLADTIGKLRDDQKDKLLKFATDWNTNSKNCQPAQLVLNILINEIQTSSFRPTGLSSVIEGALPYTERHFRRVTQMMQDLHFLSYTINCMQPHAKPN